MAVTGLLGYILKTIGLLYAQPLEGIGRVKHVQIATFIFQPPNKHIVGNIHYMCITHIVNVHIINCNIESILQELQGARRRAHIVCRQ